MSRKNKPQAAQVSNVETSFETQQQPEQVVAVVETPLPVEPGTIDQQPTFEMPARPDSMSDLDYANLVAKALKATKKTSQPKTSDYKPKLTYGDAIFIMQELNKGTKQSWLAQHFNVHPSTISDVKAGRLYKQARIEVPFAPPVGSLQTLPQQQPPQIVEVVEKVEPLS